MNDLPPLVDNVTVTELLNLVRQPLRRLAPYDPGPTVSELRAKYGLTSIAKLNWNEDLFGLLPGVREAVVEELARAELYPEQAYSDFRHRLGARIGADPAMLVPSHGIQSLVFATIGVFINPGDRVVIPQPTYGLYRKACEAAGAAITFVPNNGYRLDLDALLRASQGAKLVFLCDPNNPTGDALTPEEWRRFINRLPEGCVAAVDEAYADYLPADQRPDRIAHIAAGRPVVVWRTFSKLYGLAGLRLGYAIVHPDLVPAFDAVQEPFNVNRLALAAGKACLRDPEMVEERRRQVVAAREALAADLKELGISSWPSQSNFLLANPGGDDRQWYERLLKRGFLVRRGSEYGLSGHLRITIGPERLMTSLVAAMAEVQKDLGRGVESAAV